MYTTYFSFKTFSRSGIADQIGAQFSHCYSLGCQCGWTYLHLEPFEFDRPTPGCQRRKDMSSIVEYLGLTFTDPRPSVKVEISILLSSLIEDASSIQHVLYNFQLLIEKSIGNADASASTNSSILVHLELDSHYHSLIPSIQRLTGMNWEKTLQFSGIRYLQERRSSRVSRFGPYPVAVAHIRLGDCIRIDTVSCPVILHGDMVFTSLASYQQEVGSCDPSRVSKIVFRPFDFLEKVKTLMHVNCIQVEHLYLVSDGFKTTKRSILSHILHRKLSLDVGILALRKVNELELMFSNAIRFVPLSQRVFGENPHDTLLSIELFLNASLLMCNVGGFSNTIYNIYNPSSASGSSFVWL